MKNITFKSYLFALACIISGNFLNAQSVQEKKEITKSYNKQLLSEMAEKFSDQFYKDLEKAEAYARQNNIPTTIYKEDGGIAILHKVLDDGTLIYTETKNRGAGLTVRADKVYTGGGLDLSIEGQGMTVGIWDGGAVRASHELLGTSRVIQVDGATSISNHATHVAGTLMGSDVPQNGNARGMAFKASLQANSFNNDLSEMTSQASGGLLISNHSYGSGVDNTTPLYYYGNYESKAAAVDNLCYNTPYYTIVKSAGNDRNDGLNPSDSGYDLLTDFGVSKNVIVVAAVNQVTNYTGPSSVVMSNFSSWGPTDDGRIKPDISAKGVGTFSSVGSFDAAYGTMSGTSMASPSVAGSLVLLQQLHNDLQGSFMKSATVRGLAIHTASEAGPNPGPDFSFGWGLLNVEDAAIALKNQGATSIIEENNLANGATFTKTGTALGTQPLMVTIAWTDPAGTVQGTTVDDPTSRLVNDLDVVLEDEGGNLFYPWVLNGGFTAGATKGNNTKDNVEKVEISAPSGEYTIRVTHKGTLVNGSQDFSIIVTGISESDFSFVADNVSKEFCSDEVATYTFNYSSVVSYNGPTALSVTGLPAGTSATITPNIITADEDFTVEVSGLENIAEGSYTFTVTGTGPTTDVRTTDLEMVVFSAAPLADTAINFPSDGATDVFIYPNLQWDAVPNNTEYKVEVSFDASFFFNAFEFYTTDTNLDLPGLTSNTLYYWRVKATTHCEDSNYATASFTTETLDCNAIVSATDTPISIGLTPQTIQSVINIPVDQDILIGAVKVGVNLTHTYIGDLRISLTSPEGTEVVLVNESCGEFDNINATFTDAGTQFTCLTTTPTISGNRKPQNLLNAFVGEDSAGDWTLKIIDGYDGDGGTLNSFTLELCSTDGPALSVNESDIEGFAIFPNPAKDNFEFTVANPSSNLNVGVYDVNGRLLLSNKFNASRNSVNVESLSTGVYFVKVINGNQEAVKKLIIE